MTNTQIHYCRDCFFVRNKYNGEENWKCRSPKNVAVSLTTLLPIISIITGDPIPQFDTCLSARNHNATGCGRDGVWFESHQQHLTKLRAKSAELPTVSGPRPSKIGIEDL